MNDEIITNLKLVYKPLIMYYGEWELLPRLEEISLKDKNGKSLFEAYLERYYYTPLSVIFKDEELSRSFKYAICSRLGESGRSLYFSKKAFLRNVIANADEIVENSGDEIYQEIKKALRDRKDIYRDVDKNGENSRYYESIKKEYVSCGYDVELEEFVSLCKKKYTRLLSGYNAVLDLFDKAINVDKFIACFEPIQLYLLTCYSVLKHGEKQFEAYGKLDYNVVVLDSFRELVEKARKEDDFFNSHIMVGESIYTIDDLFKEYDELQKRVNEK